MGTNQSPVYPIGTSLGNKGQTPAAPLGLLMAASPWVLREGRSARMTMGTVTVDVTASSVYSMSGGVMSFIGVGTCVLNANQAGNDYYHAAAHAQQSFTVAKATGGVHSNK